MRLVRLVVLAFLGALAITPAAAAQGRSYNPRVRAIEVTQGVQRFDPMRVQAAAGGPRYHYAGVPLEFHRRTAVRVFVDLQSSGEVEGIASLTVRLSVLRRTPQGWVRSGQPLRPLYGPEVVSRTLPLGSIPMDVRSDPRAAFTFLLPLDLTGRRLRDGIREPGIERTRLVATVVAPPDTAKLRECRLLPCRQDSSMVLRGVNFNSTCCVRVIMVKLTSETFNNPQTGRAYTEPGPAPDALRPILSMTPVDVRIHNPRRRADGYTTKMDISRLLEEDVRKNPNSYPGGPPPGSPCCFDPKPELIELLETYRAAFRRQGREPPFGIFGIWPQELPAGQGIPSAQVGATGFDLTNRPLTALGHEFGHTLGRQHFSTGCGGQPSDPSVPDNIGLINGVGIDLFAPRPFPILVTPEGVGDTPGQRDDAGIYDPMSYCATLGGGLSEERKHVMTSVYGWEWYVRKFVRYSARTPGAY